MPRSASTGNGSRRGLLKALAFCPGAVALSSMPAGAADYASAGEALSDIDHLQADVTRRLQRLPEGRSRDFARSLLRDLERHREERDALRREMGLGPAPAAPAVVAAADEALLDELRTALEKLTYAHAEALPVLDHRPAVRALARHMTDLSRHLTLVGLWIEAEESRG